MAPSQAASRAAAPGRAVHAIWGSELSPFALKLRALLDYAGIPYRWLPAEGGRLENLRALRRVARAKRTRTAIRYPAMSELDEYPLVPFLIEEGGDVYYDSSALARWIDERHPPASGPLFPEEPAQAFLAQLIDEAFDEFGLYMVHHNRWVPSAATNDAGERLAREFSRVLLPGMGGRFARRFSRRQTRRLPYLFSVAPPELAAVRPGVPAPPALEGFPETQRLLEEAWEAYLDGMEAVLGDQPYLLGERFTVADASAYGQLGMNLSDPSAADRMRDRAPLTHSWLCAIRDARHAGSSGSLHLEGRLHGLVEIILRSFVPLMRQNQQAYREARQRGETLFNESAFDAGRALYDGTLLGKPFRSVVKSFQVQVWSEIRAAWDALSSEERDQLAPLIGDGAAFG
jgi:glutathione S-transferase